MLVIVPALFWGCTKNNEITAPSLEERIIIDTPYGESSKQKMDIYLPKGRTKSTKVVFLIHGGEWMSGDKSEMNNYVSSIRSQWPECAIVNVNYRFANGSTVTAKELLNDIAASVKFVADNKSSLNISSDFAMMGLSAGAQLALSYTYSQNTNNHVKCVADLYGPAVINDWEWYKSYNVFLGKSIKDVLVNYTGKNWEDDAAIYQLNSPFFTVKAAYAKPTIIFHGDADVVVPVYQSQWLNAKLDSLSVPHQYVEYRLDGHGFNEMNSADCMNKSIAFFKNYLK